MEVYFFDIEECATMDAVSNLVMRDVVHESGDKRYVKKELEKWICEQKSHSLFIFDNCDKLFTANNESLQEFNSLRTTSES